MFNNLEEQLRELVKKSVMVGMYGGKVNSTLFAYGVQHYN